MITTSCIHEKVQQRHEDGHTFEKEEMIVTAIAFNNSEQRDAAQLSLELPKIVAGHSIVLDNVLCAKLRKTYMYSKCDGFNLNFIVI